MAKVSLNGVTCVECHLYVPKRGVWYADVTLQDDEDVGSGNAELKIEDDIFSGVFEISRSGSFGGSRKARVIGGHGGWHKMATPKDYHNDVRVKCRQIALDAASDVGEVLLSFESDAKVEIDFVRGMGTAAVCMSKVAVRAGIDWWVQYDGSTIAKKRILRLPDPASYAILNYDPLRNVAEVSVDNATDLQIGDTLTARVDTPVIVSSLEFHITPEIFRAIVHCGSVSQSPIVDSLRNISSTIANEKLYGKYRYSVNAMSGNRVNLQVVNKNLGLPNILQISMAIGIAGTHTQLKSGAQVFVEFEEGERSKPLITGFIGKDGAGYVPQTITIGENSVAEVARKGDTVRILLPPMVFNGTIGGTPAAGVVASLTGSTLGTIEVGSPLLKLGVS